MTQNMIFLLKKVNLLNSPNSFLTIVPGMSFEDALITEYCTYLIDTFLVKVQVHLK
jgi:hypothetical protein